MSIFEDITLTYGGKDYTIPSNGVMRLIAKIEDVISLHELTVQPALSKLAEAYTVALVYAGCKKVKTEEVYASLFGDGGRENIEQSITTLITMMVPPPNFQPDEEKSGKK